MNKVKIEKTLDIDMFTFFIMKNIKTNGQLQE